jgi:hypothetical protein
MEQIQNLGHAGLCDVSEGGQFRLVANDAVSKHPLKPNRQRHQPGNPRHSPRFYRFLVSLRQACEFSWCGFDRAGTQVQAVEGSSASVWR